MLILSWMSLHDFARVRLCSSFHLARISHEASGIRSNRGVVGCTPVLKYLSITFPHPFFPVTVSRPLFNDSFCLMLFLVTMLSRLVTNPVVFAESCREHCRDGLERRVGKVFRKRTSSWFFFTCIKGLGTWRYL